MLRGVVGVERWVTLAGRQSTTFDAPVGVGSSKARPVSKVVACVVLHRSPQQRGLSVAGLLLVPAIHAGEHNPPALAQSITFEHTFLMM